MIVPYRVLYPNSAPGGFQNRRGPKYGTRQSLFDANVEPEHRKIAGARQYILEIAGGATRHLKNRRGRKMAQDFPPPAKLQGKNIRPPLTIGKKSLDPPPNCREKS